MTPPRPQPEPQPEGAIRRRVVVRGRVQGVGFRMSCARRARTAGLTGWVRNREDRSVEAAFEGAARDVEDIVRWCHHGPGMAVVDDVAISDETPQGESGFTIR